MEFEYNSHKSKINQAKHGIDFQEAQTIWLGDHILIPALIKDEPRFMIIGPIKSHIYSCIFTPRGRKIRIISCRRSSEKERTLYHEKIR